MNRSWWMRFGLLCFFVFVAVIHVIPTVANLNLETTKFPFKKKVNLGLDLQGGLYMVYGVDFKKVYIETFSRSAESFVGELNKAGVNATLGPIDSSMEEDPKALVSFDPSSQAKVKELMDRQGYILRQMEESPGSLLLALGRDYRIEIKESTLGQSVQVIRNRIDEFGVTEPSIATKGDNRIVVELPGVKDVERAKALVGRTARLEFKMVNSEANVNLPLLISEAEAAAKISYKEGEKFSEYVAAINNSLKAKIPADSEVRFERKPGNVNIPYLLFSKVELTGNELSDARVAPNPETQAPEVAFQMNPKGAITFEDLTRKWSPRQTSRGEERFYLAIVLDDIVYSAPGINGPIPGGSGVIQLGTRGEEAYKEARDLAIVLRAGALPAQLDLLEQRVIGPSLGADSIRHGMNAALVGCVLVLIFVTIYYRMSGAVAAVSLLLNGIFLFAILIGIDATLTLPGIAGLALTIGMAVDSNVIIFERIRDELRDGKPVAPAVQAGFDKAFATILDANVTHGIVAIILLNFGTGPLRGFAVTLLIGIATTLFCAVTVCKLFFDAYLGRGRKVERLSI